LYFYIIYRKIELFIVKTEESEENEENLSQMFTEKIKGDFNEKLKENPKKKPSKTPKNANFNKKIDKIADYFTENMKNPMNFAKKPSQKSISHHKFHIKDPACDIFQSPTLKGILSPKQVLFQKKSALASDFISRKLLNKTVPNSRKKAISISEKENCIFKLKTSENHLLFSMNRR